MTRWPLVLGLLLLAQACKKSNDVDVNNGPTGNNNQSLPVCDDGVGPGLHGPIMVHVGRLDGSCFWMDQTEVTAAQYAEFLAGSPSNASGCEGTNTDFEPMEGVDMSQASLPIGGIDWCDAASFCSWAGKRLCGVYAAPTGEMSEMESTCTDGDGASFRYDEALSLASGNCQGNATAASPVESHPDCRTPTDVYDLVGNVREWTSECDGASCHARGGSFESTSSDDFGCKRTISLPKTIARLDVGFRCCGDDTAP